MKCWFCEIVYRKVLSICATIMLEGTFTHGFSLRFIKIWQNSRAFLKIKKAPNLITGILVKSLKHLIFYQTSHFEEGFILLFEGQWKSIENSFILLIGPRTRNIPGEWTPVVILIFIASVIRVIKGIKWKGFIYLSLNYLVCILSTKFERQISKIVD